ncbi:hypothetical protein BJ138DRAFT_1149664 [Hygrophoropsis aurantiaca]|uniref:Uncharacterized protein n=1 Tax=Hygrophoropsis aurantiaca TaxID=72124 RepID=A0ACB8AG44_9AGAM|nr:hypothetical protein BJ138DRAFT_1149664 [Hygrophoropsis aurantiaca]
MYFEPTVLLQNHINQSETPLSMGPNTPFLDALSAHLPSEYSSVVDSLKSGTSRDAVETLIRYAVGGECLPDVSFQARQDWARKQPQAMSAVQGLVRQAGSKRGRDAESDGIDEGSKRQKIDGPNDQDDPPLFTLPSISTTSPVRKKVDITMHKHSIRFVNPASRALEASIPLADINRAFILPTRGKAKPHWTVVMLTVDAPGKGKSTTATPQQIIFGIDAASTSKFETTDHSPSNPSSTGIAKGDDTLPSIRRLLTYLPIPVLEPSMTVFRSACATAKSGNGAAGVDAYLSAKPGTLWFFTEGILWGESKPCEFWALEDILEKDGLRLVSATGRTCSVIIGRKLNSGGGDMSGGDDEEEEEGGGIETEFAMIDGREQDPISAWQRQRKNLFGKKLSNAGTNAPAESSSKGKQKSVPQGPTSGAANGAAWDDSDSDDEDYELESSVDLDQSSSSSSEESGDGGDPGPGSDEEGSNAGSENGAESDEEEDLDPAKHPLLRPGAMPRMSKAAINAAVDLINGDLLGGGSDEEDELEE